MSKIINEGILPEIELLSTKFNQFVEEIEPLFNTISDSKVAGEVHEQLESIMQRVTELPAHIAKSYELIQMVIHSIHSSRDELAKSVDGLLKKTGAQLKKITSTTEDATNKIMDIAENLDMEQENILKLLDEVISENNLSENPQIGQIKDKLRSNQDSAFTIIDYLQFQDITAQQIAGAMALLADTEKTLIFVSSMLKRIDSADDILDQAQHLIDKKSFNADANFADKTDVQTAIDELFLTGDLSTAIPLDLPHESHTLDNIEEIVPASEATDDFDIDSLFDAPAPAAPEAEKKADDVSQDDIDALFS